MKRSGPFQDGKGRWREPNGRFMKVGAAIAAAGNGRKHDGPMSGTLAGVASKVAASRRRDEAVERTFASAAKAAKATPAAAAAPRSEEEERVARVTADAAARRAERDAAALHRHAQTLERAGNLHPQTEEEVRALADRMGLKVFNVYPNGHGGISAAYAHKGHSNGQRIADYDSDKGWTISRHHSFGRNPDDDQIAALLDEGARERYTDKADEAARARVEELNRARPAEAAVKRQREAALNFGGQENHAIRFDPPGTPGVESRDSQIEADIRSFVAKMHERKMWVSLALVRDDLEAKGYSREEQDAALHRMRRQPDIRVVHTHNPKGLTAAEHAASLRVGVSDAHAIRIEPPQEFDPVTLDEMRADLAARERSLQVDVNAGMPEEFLTGRRESIAELRQKVADMEGASKPPTSKPKRGSLSQAASRLAATTQSGSELARARADLADVEADLASDRFADLGDSVGLRGRRRSAEALRERIAALEGGTATVLSDGEVKDRVQAAYASLGQPGDLVSLVRLRDKLKGIDRATLDRVLKQMDRQRLIQLEPDPNQKALPVEARDASIRLGGEDKHFIFIR